MINVEELLSEPRIVAVVGLSPNQARTSNSIARYLIENNFIVIPINPNCEEVLGQRCYPDLGSVPSDVKIEIVNIFRRPRFTAGVVQEAAQRKKATEQSPVIWTQIGVSSSEAAQLATENGLEYVANRCILVEHQRIAFSAKNE